MESLRSALFPSEGAPHSSKNSSFLLFFFLLQKKSIFLVLDSRFFPTFALAFAPMAELVDALVSNTNEAIRAGSIPARGTQLESFFVKLSISFYRQVQWAMTEGCHTSMCSKVMAFVV